MIPIADADIDRMIAEDFGHGDLTTRALGIASHAGRMSFTARDAMVVSGIDEAARILVRLGAVVDIRVFSGAYAAPGTLLLEASGTASCLHAGWKIAQTLVEWSAGIASAVHDIEAAARAVSPSIVVACTRKTAPLTRALSMKAVLAGGGTLHRTGLGDSILVFPEHRAFLGGVDLRATLGDLRAAAPERAVVVEVGSPEDALLAANSGADVVQLEKFTPAQVAALRETLAGRQVKLAAAGGVNVRNAADYARAGADILVTSAPYLAAPRDVQVSIREAVLF
jgi:molybdenum transport protein